MTKIALSSTRSDRLRALAASLLAASLVACGGGGGSGGDIPPAPPPPPVDRCVDPVAAATASVKFATPVAPAASSVELSRNALSACFLGTAEAGVRSDVAAPQGESNFYYFEATRSTVSGVTMGVSATADTAPPTGGFQPRADSLLIRGDEVVTVDSQTRAVAAGSGSVFGFAVDLRADYPVVSVIAPASVNPTACAPATGATPCVIRRWQFTAAAAALYIHAYGSGNGTTGPRVSINTGADLLARPYTYSTASVMAALGRSRVQGARGFNAQWPGASGPAAQPMLARAGHDRVVVRKGAATFLPSALVVTPSEHGNGTITWQDETSVARGTGASLPINSALVDNANLPVGEHVFRAQVVNPTNGRYAEVSYRVLVLSSVADSDDDGDGLTYSAEIALGTEPGNADSDGDGLADGAEAGLGKNPLVADNDADMALPRRAALAYESGTSRGLIVGDDGLSVVFTSELNPACVQHVAPFDDPIYTSVAYGPEERCRKRAIRANVGVVKGDFRYFETQRIVNALQPADLQNIGHGIITPSAPIDPYCCYVDPIDEASIFPYNGTPPSMTVNSVGGVFVKLIQTSAGFSPDFSLTNTTYYGFAVDYTGAEPKVYVVMRDASGVMTVSGAIEVTGFADAAAMPMLHGHPTSETVASAAMNLGLQKFHYDLTAVKTALGNRGANTANFKPGVGAHLWQ